ncbi:uncharacterized protein LOC122878874 isoform X2 [Siniperca chuatsi]|uniref:uncharacterized protein LOC122878874 isoform X2 n=1 Tax=Siniperca chuatsi TaxID=119488 RepID=UPI001CE165DC|nr:uncharacterized protein LOC122878874 isoform X2 [Siniperca chuatsi]
MSVYKNQQPSLKKFRLSFYICAVVVILYLIKLIWNYRPDRSFQSWIPPRPAPLKPIPVPPSCSGKIVPREQNGTFVAVIGTKTQLVAAYWEHRTGKKEVRVVAVVLRSEAVDYYCHLCCQGKLNSTKGVIDIIPYHFGFAYGTAYIMCPLPSGCDTPSHIAVTSAADSKDKLEFLEVKNKKAKSDSFPYNFTVCFSTMYNFKNVLQLVQSLEMMQLLGVNRVVIYKTSCNDDTQRILDYYTRKGLVEVIPWSMSRFLRVSDGWKPNLNPGDIHYYGQIPALNDCIYRYMYQSRYVALHDTDELILPQSVNRPPPPSKTPPPQNHDWKNVSGVNILAHLYHEPVTSLNQYNYKIIVNPRVVFCTAVHGEMSSQIGSSVDSKIARMYHTRAPAQPKLTADRLIYDDRLLKYSAHLTRSVDTVLRDSGLLPQNSTQ